MSKGWYERKSDFTPYTKADGQAVSDEFDAIQASFERIPEMRNDGKGFAVSPLIPNPTLPEHPVPLSMLKDTETSVNNAKDLVLQNAAQVKKNTTSVANNAAIVETAKNTANAAANTATQKAQSATASEMMAKKWASNPLDQIVQGEHFSAYHYATKARESENVAKSSAETATSAKNSATASAATATTKANEAAESARQAKEAAFGRNEWRDIQNVPRASTTQQGITQLTNALDSDAESLSLTARAGKSLKALIDALTRNLGNYIPNSKKSNAVNSPSADTVATSVAVKSAYDKAVTAENLAKAKYTAQNASTTQRGITQHYSGYDSDREDLSASAKVIKLLKGFIDSNTRSLANYIPNSKKSSAVNSTSADTVANSIAVKTAYDRGTEGVNAAVAAQKTANSASTAAAQANTNANGRVSKNGDTVNGLLYVKRDKALLGIISAVAKYANLDLTTSNGTHAQVTYGANDVGNGCVEARIHTTPRGKGVNSDRRVHQATLNEDGLWVRAYGWLHSSFTRIGSFTKSSYPTFYQGAEVFKNDVSRLKITVLHKTLNKVGYSDSEDFFLITLPEPHTGFSLAIANAFSRYSGTGSIFPLPTSAEVIDNGTKVKVYCNADGYGAYLNIIVIGSY